MSEKAIFAGFIAWLDKAWWHLPASEHLFPSIMAFLKPDEAELLTGFPFMPAELKDIAALKGMAPHELMARLDPLAKKGAVWRTERGRRIFYYLNDAFFIFFRGPFYAIDHDQAARAMAPPLNRYLHDGLMDQLALAHTKPLRAIPIDKTIEDPRRITKEETKDILALAADAGLVHAVSNRRQEADTICNCCTCSCVFLESYHVLKQQKSRDFSNYRVKINQTTCKACGLCVERCPVQALTLADCALAGNERGEAATLDVDRCLGCGVCVHKCPTQSLILERREEIHHPPEDAREWMKRWITDHKQTRAGRTGTAKN